MSGRDGFAVAGEDRMLQLEDVDSVADDQLADPRRESREEERMHRQGPAGRGAADEAAEMLPRRPTPGLEDLDRLAVATQCRGPIPVLRPCRQAAQQDPCPPRHLPDHVEITHRGPRVGGIRQAVRNVEDLHGSYRSPDLRIDGLSLSLRCPAMPSASPRPL